MVAYDNKFSNDLMDRIIQIELFIINIKIILLGLT